MHKDSLANSSKDKRDLPIARYMVVLTIIWTAAIGVSLWFGISSTYNYAEESARVQARTAFEKDIVYRRWISNLGGVYAKVTEKTPPNPYLKVPDLVIDGPGGKYTLINPAYMTRLVHELGELDSGVLGHITSNKPIRPQNAPDPWEKKALQQLERGEKAEVSELQKIYGNTYMRLIRPLVTESSCMKCHAFQGYKVGDLRGGISVSVPMAPLMKTANETVQLLVFSHVGLWLIGIACFIIGAQNLRRRVQERDEAERQLLALTEELEDRIVERTREVREQQQKLQAFMDNTEAGVYMKTLNHEYTLVNKRFASFFDVKAEEVIGKLDASLLPLEALKQIRKCEEEVMEKRSPVEIKDLSFSPESGTVFSCYIFPVFDDTGTIEALGGMMVDTTQRNQLEIALRNSRDAAESANRAKSDFLANISHEIRTPLNGIIGMSDMLLRTKLTTEQSSMTATIKTASDNLLLVLNDILDFSKIEAGKMRLDRLPFNLRDTIFDAVKGLTPIAFKKGLELIVHISPQVPNVLVGDALRLRQILLNLISNAIKFTEKGDVTLTVRIKAQSLQSVRLYFSISDTGIGIEREKQKIIFSAFEQADTSTTRKYGGTGLGLAITHRLLLLMESRLDLESQVGVGSTFWFEIELPYMCEIKGSENLVSALAFKNVRALIVDDNATNRQIFMEQLLAWGMHPEESESVDEALRLLRVAADARMPFQIVLSDLQMPGKDGLDLLRNIRQAENLRSTPVILLSSCDLPPNLPSGLFQVNLTKPARPEELLRAISTALGVWEKVGMEHLQAQAVEEAKRTSTAKLKILLVEDMEMNQLVATRMLGSLGHEVTVAANGLVAVEAFEKEHFDMIFMDIQMPVMDGIDATKLIRKKEAEDPSGSKIPIVAMTAYALKGDKEKYLDLGMDAYLSKPVQFKEMAEIVDTLIGQHSLQDTAETPQEDKKEEESPLFEKYYHKCLDSEIIAQSFAENEDLLTESINLYLRDAPKLLIEMASAIDHDDNSALTVNAHALKGLTSYYTRGEVYEACYALEQMGRESALDSRKTEATRKLAELNSLVEDLMKEMNEVVEKDKS